MAGPDIPRVESAHMMIALHTTIHDSSVTLLSNSLSGNFMIYPIWISPHGLIDLTKLNGGTCIVLDGVFELLVKVSIV